MLWLQQGKTTIALTDPWKTTGFWLSVAVIWCHCANGPPTIVSKGSIVTNQTPPKKESGPVLRGEKNLIILSWFHLPDKFKYFINFFFKINLWLSSKVKFCSLWAQKDYVFYKFCHVHFLVTSFAYKLVTTPC